MIRDESMAMVPVGGDFLIFVHGKETASANAWDQLLTFYKQNRKNIPNYRVLVVTDGGGPTPAMRKDIQKEFGSEMGTSRTAIVCDASVMRFTVSAISLFVSNIKIFGSKNYPDALSFLHLKSDERQLVSDALMSLKKTLGPSFRTFHSIDPAEMF